MKRPTIEYALIGVGSIIFAVSLVTAIPDLGPYAVSALCSLLVFLPFCLSWQRTKHPFIYLLSLLVPILCCWIGIPQLISIYQALQNGKDVFTGLPFSTFLGFLNMHLLIIGTLAVTFYAMTQALGGPRDRTSASSQ